MAESSRGHRPRPFLSLLFLLLALSPPLLTSPAGRIEDIPVLEERIVTLEHELDLIRADRDKCALHSDELSQGLRECIAKFNRVEKDIKSSIKHDSEDVKILKEKMEADRIRYEKTIKELSGKLDAAQKELIQKSSQISELTKNLSENLKGGCTTTCDAQQYRAALIEKDKEIYELKEQIEAFHTSYNIEETPKESSNKDKAAQETNSKKDNSSAKRPTLLQKAYAKIQELTKKLKNRNSEKEVSAVEVTQKKLESIKKHVIEGDDKDEQIAELLSELDSAYAQIQTHQSALQQMSSQMQDFKHKYPTDLDELADRSKSDPTKISDKTLHTDLGEVLEELDESYAKIKEQEVQITQLRQKLEDAGHEPPTKNALGEVKDKISEFSEGAFTKGKSMLKRAYEKIQDLSDKLLHSERFPRERQIEEWKNKDASKLNEKDSQIFDLLQELDESYQKIKSLQSELQTSTDHMENFFSHTKHPSHDKNIKQSLLKNTDELIEELEHAQHRIEELELLVEKLGHDLADARDGLEQNEKVLKEAASTEKDGKNTDDGKKKKKNIIQRAFAKIADLTKRLRDRELFKKKNAVEEYQKTKTVIVGEDKEAQIHELMEELDQSYKKLREYETLAHRAGEIAHAKGNAINGEKTEDEDHLGGEINELIEDYEHATQELTNANKRIIELEHELDVTRVSTTSCITGKPQKENPQTVGLLKVAYQKIRDLTSQIAHFKLFPKKSTKKPVEDQKKVITDKQTCEENAHKVEELLHNLDTAYATISELQKHNSHMHSQLKTFSDQHSSYNLHFSPDSDDEASGKAYSNSNESDLEILLKELENLHVLNDKLQLEIQALREENPHNAMLLAKKILDLNSKLSQQNVGSTGEDKFDATTCAELKIEWEFLSRKFVLLEKRKADVEADNEVLKGDIKRLSDTLNDQWKLNHKDMALKALTEELDLQRKRTKNRDIKIAELERQHDSDLKQGKEREQRLVHIGLLKLKNKDLHGVNAGAIREILTEIDLAYKTIQEHEATIARLKKGELLDDKVQDTAASAKKAIVQEKKDTDHAVEQCKHELASCVKILNLKDSLINSLNHEKEQFNKAQTASQEEVLAMRKQVKVMEKSLNTANAALREKKCPECKNQSCPSCQECPKLKDCPQAPSCPACPTCPACPKCPSCADNIPREELLNLTGENNKLKRKIAELERGVETHDRDKLLCNSEIERLKMKIKDLTEDKNRWKASENNKVETERRKVQYDDGEEFVVEVNDVKPKTTIKYSTPAETECTDSQSQICGTAQLRQKMQKQGRPSEQRQDQRDREYDTVSLGSVEYHDLGAQSNHL
jgi:DNA repair exonuclease SbcCD ATPase subunit